MAKLYFKYGVMNSSKTANLLMVAYNYESQGRRILCLKPSIDTRWSDGGDGKQGVIRSRAVEQGHICELVDKNEDLYDLIRLYNNDIITKYATGIDAVLIDEAQFLTLKQVRELSLVVEKLQISVLCFGLKSTYVDGQLFEGTSALFFYGSDFEEIKTICKYCDRKATHNLRIINGEAVYTGDTVAIGDVKDSEETYSQVCYRHYLFPPAPIIGRYSKNNGVKSISENLNHILRYKNSRGYYRKLSEIRKENLITDVIFVPKNKEDYSKVRYISLGSIAIDMKQYSISNKSSKVTGISITKALIDFLYAFYESDMRKAYDMLKMSANTGIEFFDTYNDYQVFLRDRNAKNRCYQLPDNRWYYLDLHTSNIYRFWDNLLHGLRNNLGIEVQFYFEGETK